MKRLSGYKKVNECDFLVANWIGHSGPQGILARDDSEQ